MNWMLVIVSVFCCLRQFSSVTITEFSFDSIPEIFVSTFVSITGYDTENETRHLSFRESDALKQVFLTCVSHFMDLGIDGNAFCMSPVGCSLLGIDVDQLVKFSLFLSCQQTSWTNFLRNMFRGKKIQL